MNERNAPLDRELRKHLEQTVRQARRAGENGARKAFEQMGISDAEAPPHLTAEMRSLRVSLRAHARQLGDERDEKRGTQSLNHLIEECAYEHWHRMLFARFLAENDLLFEPQSGVAITLDEVQELARESSVNWLSLASGYAEPMLSHIFRKNDPVFGVALPPETFSHLEDLLKRIPSEVFLASDSIGWVYQFWQSDSKDEVNKSEAKIGADQIASVTQLFTEDYMVLFLLENTLGAWWASKVLAAHPELANSATDEQQLRTACRAGEIEWRYLRFIRDTELGPGMGVWRPAAGDFRDWPKYAKDITLLDPCMGSGHFLKAAFSILVAFRMLEENLDRKEATTVVLRDNLFGLEIDQRCTQIAAFNLAFAAWRAVGYQGLSGLNLACSGLGINVTRTEWLKLAERTAKGASETSTSTTATRGRDVSSSSPGLERLKNGLERLYDLFARAPWLGSLIDPRFSRGDILAADFEELSTIFGQMLAATSSEDTREMASAAQGMTRAAELLSKKYTLVATNVPYLGRRRQDEILRAYGDENYPASNRDLATCFVQRANEFCHANGTTALVFLQNALFLKTYEPFRRKILTDVSWSFCAKLGARAFRTPMYDFGVTLTILNNAIPSPNRQFAMVDAGEYLGIDEKVSVLSSAELTTLSQKLQLANPYSAIGFVSESSLPLLEQYSTSYQGAGLADIVIYRRYFWELQDYGKTWVLHQSSPSGERPFTGLHFAVRWEEGRGSLVTRPDATIRGRSAWGKDGIACTVLGKLPVGFYLGTLYDNSAAAIIPKDSNHLAAIWCFMSSPEFLREIRKVNQKTHVADATLVKVPFDLSRWEAVARRDYPTGLPALESSDPTQWAFGGSPESADQPLQVATARLLGYRWPVANGVSIGTRSYQITQDSLQGFADADGIVCLTAAMGAASAEKRLNDLLAKAFGESWSAAKLANLLTDVGFAGKTLDDWLRDGFFAQHCTLFRNRPFVWHVWDGRRDGFHALVNYHRLAAPGGEGRRTLEKLIYSYLGDWIAKQSEAQKASIEGADARFAAAKHLRSELTKILEGKPPYDIFVRWKSLQQQPIGWEPDVSDGVRLNIRPFMTALVLGSRGTILRVTPKVDWDKDRGKEPACEKADFPWFWTWDGSTHDFAGGEKFDAIRWNDLHYSSGAKRAARERNSSMSVNESSN